MKALMVVTVPMTTAERIDGIADALRRESGVKIRETWVMRAALDIGLGELEKRARNRQAKRLRRGKK